MISGQHGLIQGGSYTGVLKLRSESAYTEGGLIFGIIRYMDHNVNGNAVRNFFS